MSSQGDRPRPPRVSLTAVGKAASEVLSFLHQYRNLTPSRAGELARRLCGGPMKRIPLSVVYSSLLPYTDQPMSEDQALSLAYQMGGRMTELEVGPISPHLEPEFSQWLGVEVVEMQPCEWKDGRAAQLMHLRCFIGHMAGRTLVRKVPETYLRGMAYEVGFSRKFVYDDRPELFIGLAFWAFLRVTEGEDYRVEAYEMNSQMNKRNKQIIKMRLRNMIDLPEDPCPINYEWECEECENVDCPANFARYGRI